VKNSPNPIIFIIDHTVTYRKILTNCLEALNYKNIHAFSNCEEIKETLLSPDIIILDHELGLNHMKGLDFLKTHRNRYSETQFIFLSSSTNIDVVVDSIKCGAFDYIIKSRIGLERLIVKINGLVRHQTNQRSRKKILNVAVVSLGIVSLVLVVAVILYNHQII
jgi:two-component system, NtrC family, response regulator AtoC